MARSAVLLLTIASLGLAMFFAVGGMSALASGSVDSGFSLALVGVFALAFIPLFWIGMALMAKPLHDMNRSGWWMLLTMVPLLGVIYALYA